MHQNRVTNRNFLECYKEMLRYRNWSYNHAARQPQVISKTSKSTKIRGFAFLRFYNNKTQRRWQLDTRPLRQERTACRKRDIKGRCVEKIPVINDTTVVCKTHVDTTARYLKAFTAIIVLTYHSERWRKSDVVSYQRFCILKANTKKNEIRAWMPQKRMDTEGTG